MILPVHFYLTTYSIDIIEFPYWIENVEPIYFDNEGIEVKEKEFLKLNKQ